jgi:DNA-directed RNA polymerase specialized sigma24 family protein
VPAETPFEELLPRLRRGDEEAWAELICRCEGEVRRVVRSRLGAGLRPVLDSADVWQLVLASFFVRVSLGKFDLNSPRDLARLLGRMARNKVVSQGRKQEAGRRDRRRVARGATFDASQLPASGPSPSEVLCRCEPLERVQDQLRVEERLLVDRKGQAHGWEEIAREVGGAPNAAQMRLVFRASSGSLVLQDR